MSVTSGGSQEVFVDRAYERFLSAEDIARLAGASRALQICAWHGDFDVDQPFDDGYSSRRMIVVLRRLP